MKKEKEYREAFEEAFKKDKSKRWSEVDQLRYEIDLLWKSTNHLIEVMEEMHTTLEKITKVMGGKK